MRASFLSTAALFAGAAELVAANCGADNCLRALRATQTPGRLESALSFCATFTAASVAPSAIPTYAAVNCKENQNGDLNYRISSACSCLEPTSATPTPTPTEACALVSSSWSAQLVATPTPTVAAALAYDCLNSVPLNKAAAIELVDAIEPYLEWQSDAPYKADPPADYFYPGYDIFEALAAVKRNLVADKYENEYAFQLDLYVTVFGPGHDGHFVFYPDALTRVFEWRRQRSLVSISEDGKSLPVIKLYEDVLAAPEQASVVKLINGVDAAKYVETTINKAGYNQDVDSAYNSMFFEKANFAVSGSKGYFADGGRIRYIYQGPNTTFTFENGTVLTLENTASVKAPMTGVVDGESFYAAFCSAEATNIANADAKITTVELAATGDNATTVAGYPEPVIITDDGIVSGYYLTGEGFEDVAVIVLLAFENELPSEFQAVCADFFAEAVAAGKTKLVVDFQANGGGYILQGYDFFRQLFPQTQEDGFSRWKGNDAFISIAEIISDEVADLDPRTSGDGQLISDYETWFNYRYDLNLTNDNFLTFKDKFAPHVHRDTPYTAIMRWNLTDPLTTVNETFGMGMEISGYGSLSNLTQPFKPENIVMLYDGVCASTCTLASEMLRIHGGVKSVALGGRPKEGPIQGVGGVKGAQVLQFADIYDYASRARGMAQTPGQRVALARYSDLPVRRSSAAAVNVRDQILDAHDDLPAQFVAEEADCRLYWTLDMVRDVSEAWRAAADAAFNGAKCAHGAIGRPYQAGKKTSRETTAGFAPPRKRRSESIDKRVKMPVNSPDWIARYEVKVVA